jgi:CRP-like cAMP-binding protein
LLSEVSQIQRLLYLKRSPLLGTLPPPELALVADSMRERSFPKGAALSREGEPLPGLHFVTEGRVHLRRHGVDLGHAGPGDGIGGLGILARDPVGLSALAETETHTLVVDTDTIREIFEDNFTILRHILRQTCRALVAVIEKLPPGTPLGPPFRPFSVPRRDLDLVDRIMLLRETTVFARASINALAELSRNMAEAHFPDGTELWRQGEPASNLLLVVDGEVRCQTAAGHQLRMGPGSAVGSVEAVSGDPRWFTASAVGPLAALVCDPEALFDVFEDNEEMALEYLAVIARWQLALVDRLAEHRAPLREFYGCEDLEDCAPEP